MSGFEEQYTSWPRMIRESLRDWSLFRVSGDFRLVAVAGMGGSGVVGDYLARLSEVYGGLPVVVFKAHKAPRYLSKQDLLVVVSYSGNTLETIEFLNEVSGRSSAIVTMSSGGLLEEVSRSRGFLHIKLPRGLAPRASLPAMLVEVLGLLDASGYTVVSKNAVESTTAFLVKELSSIVEEAERVASFIAENKGLLIIATHYPYDVLAVRGKNEFGENAKIPVKVEVAPEWMHNDIVGWEKPYPNKYSVLAVVDESDSVGLKLVNYMVGVYRDLGFPVYELMLRGESFIDKLLYGSLLFGLASVKTAYKHGVDPLATISIQKYKERVREIFGVLKPSSR